VFVYQGLEATRTHDEGWTACRSLQAVDAAYYGVVLRDATGGYENDPLCHRARVLEIKLDDEAVGGLLEHPQEVAQSRVHATVVFAMCELYLPSYMTEVNLYCVAAVSRRDRLPQDGTLVCSVQPSVLLATHSQRHCAQRRAGV